MFDAALQKCCCRCGQLKDSLEFNFKNRSTDRRHPFCRTCQHAWNREHYQRNKATYIANAKRNNARYEAENLARLVAYLQAHPCVDCGETDLLVLQFDHRDRETKRMAIGDLVRYASWNALELEIAKCDVRCANCHQRRTAEQFGWRKMALTGQGRQGSNLQTSRFGDERSAN